MFNFKKNKKENDKKENTKKEVEGIDLLKNVLLPKEEPTPVHTEVINNMTVNLYAKKEVKEAFFWEKVSHDAIPNKEEKQPQTIEEYYKYHYSKEKLPNIQVTFRASKDQTNDIYSLQKQFKIA